MLALLFALLLQHAPHEHKWPPWIVYEPEAASSQTGPHIEAFGSLQGGSDLTISGYRFPSKVGVLVFIGNARIDKALGTGKVVPELRWWWNRHAMADGCLTLDLRLPKELPSVGKLYLQCACRSEGRAILTNAIVLDLEKRQP